MELLVAVIVHEDRIEEILRAFLEIGISGATVIDSRGMGRLLGGEMPDFAKLQNLVTGARPKNKTLFSVIDDPAKTDAALEAIQRISGSLTGPATGIAFTVPVNQALGLAAAIPGDDEPPASDP
jgi:nitrogen regulatory protein P-II 1